MRLPIVRLEQNRNVYLIVIHRDGQPRERKSTGTGNKKIAETLRKEVERVEVARALGLIAEPVTPPTSPPLPKVYREYIRAQRTKGNVKSHVRNVRRQLRMFFDFAKARTLADVTQAHVEDYLAHVAQDQSQKSMLDKLVIIRSAGRWAVKRGYIAANPAEAVEVRKPARMPVKIIDARAVEKMIDEKKSPGTRALLALAAYAGMRRAEIIALRWDEIDLTGRWIDVSNREDRRTKTGVNRRVPILDPLLSYLVALPRTGPRVFPTVNDLRAASRRGPLQVLRHTAITSWLRSGASIGTCAEWAGNSNDVIESNYRARQCPDPVRFTFHGLPLVPHGLPEVPAGLRKVQ